jgi:hypothetical protein
LYFIVTICTVIATLIAVGRVIERRRRRQINRIVAGIGGRVVAIRGYSTPTTRIVDYIRPQGELRRASLRSGETRLSDDRQFQLVLRDQYQDSRSEALASLRLAAQYSKLPGFQEYQSLVRRLAAGSLPSATIHELPGDGQEEWKFAPILQCIEAVSIGSIALPTQTLELRVDGNKFKMRWSVEGTVPRRSLVVKVTRPE